MQTIGQHRTSFLRPAAAARAQRTPRMRPAAFQQATALVTHEKTAYKGDPSHPLEVDAESVAKDIRKKAEVTVGAPDASHLSDVEAYRATAWSVREKLFDAFFKTQKHLECASFHLL